VDLELEGEEGEFAVISVTFRRLSIQVEGGEGVTRWS